MKSVPQTQITITIRDRRALRYIRAAAAWHRSTPKKLLARCVRQHFVQLHDEVQRTF
jgi:hypothetical protein